MKSDGGTARPASGVPRVSYGPMAARLGDGERPPHPPVPVLAIGRHEHHGRPPDRSAAATQRLQRQHNNKNTKQRGRPTPPPPSAPPLRRSSVGVAGLLKYRNGARVANEPPRSESPLISSFISSCWPRKSLCCATIVNAASTRRRHMHHDLGPTPARPGARRASPIALPIPECNCLLRRFIREEGMIVLESYSYLLISKDTTS